MADTIRTLAELNQLLADNTQGSITPQDIRDILASMNVHAEIGAAGPGSNVGTEWEKVLLDREGTFERGFIVDTVNNRIGSTPCRMKVLVQCEVLFETDLVALGRTLDVTVFKNDSQLPELRRTFYSQGGHSWAVGVQAQTDDYFDMRVRASENDTFVQASRALLRIQRIGVE